MKQELELLGGLCNYFVCPSSSLVPRLSGQSCSFVCTEESNATSALFGHLFAPLNELSSARID